MKAFQPHLMKTLYLNTMNRINKKIQLRFGILETVDCYGAAQFKIQKPFHSAPGRLREFYDTDNTRMYECEGGRLFVADTYDKMFLPERMKIKHKRYKGDNPSYIARH